MLKVITNNRELRCVYVQNTFMVIHCINPNSPLEISEVTVTVETIKYNQPAISEEFVCEKTVAEDASEGSTDPIAVGHSSFATQETETDAGAEQKVWHFPISAIQTLEDGKQVVEIPTPVGPKIVPVPTLAPGTSNVIVMATDAPDSPEWMSRKKWNLVLILLEVHQHQKEEIHLFI
nr:uncharacterized protein LOC113825957 isoform X2 [Penaeus vannamei]